MTGSFDKVDYRVRPAKAVSRHIMVEIVKDVAGVHAKDLIYVGLGSIHYADFVLLHKELGLRSMVCVESKAPAARMQFNKPFDFINLEMTELSQYLPSLELDERYWVWLDYDSSVERYAVADLKQVIASLSGGSFVFATVAAQIRAERRDEHRMALTEVFGSYARPAEIRDLSNRRYPQFVSEALESLVQSIASDRGVMAHRIATYMYRDQREMLVVGWYLNEADAIELPPSEWIVSSTTPVEIELPILTIREQLWLDQRLEVLRENDRQEVEATMGVEAKVVESYLRYQRFIPRLAEVGYL